MGQIHGFTRREGQGRVAYRKMPRPAEIASGPKARSIRSLPQVQSASEELQPGIVKCTMRERGRCAGHHEPESFWEDFDPVLFFVEFVISLLF
jgi:hypothetical protein